MVLDSSVLFITARCALNYAYITMTGVGAMKNVFNFMKVD